MLSGVGEGDWNPRRSSLEIWSCQLRHGRCVLSPRTLKNSFWSTFWSLSILSTPVRLYLQPLVRTCHSGWRHWLEAHPNKLFSKLASYLTFSSKGRLKNPSLAMTTSLVILSASSIKASPSTTYFPSFSSTSSAGPVRRSK